MKNMVMTLKDWLFGVKKQPVVVELCYGRHNDYMAAICIDGRWNSIDADWQSVQEWIAHYAPDQVKWVGAEPDNEVWHMPHKEFNELYQYHLKQFQQADAEQREAMLLRCRTLRAMGHIA